MTEPEPAPPGPAPLTLQPWAAALPSPQPLGSTTALAGRKGRGSRSGVAGGGGQGLAGLCSDVWPQGSHTHSLWSSLQLLHQCTRARLELLVPIRGGEAQPSAQRHKLCFHQHNIPRGRCRGRGTKTLVHFMQCDKSTEIHLGVKVECALNTWNLQKSPPGRSQAVVILHWGCVLVFDKTDTIHVPETNCSELWAQHLACGLWSSWDLLKCCWRQFRLTILLCI